ncbi:hypothetical protein Dimus_038261 [Dionaea muscipula]
MHEHHHEPEPNTTRGDQQRGEQEELTHQRFCERNRLTEGEPRNRPESPTVRPQGRERECSLKNWVTKGGKEDI